MFGAIPMGPKRLTVTELRLLGAGRDEYVTAQQSHILDQVEFLRTVAPNADPENPTASMRASDFRKFERRNAIIAELREAIPLPAALNIQAALLRLYA